MLDAEESFIEITREMGTNHKDFLRLLPKSVPDAQIQMNGSPENGAHIKIEGAPINRIEIDMSPETIRKIALLTLPVTHITFRFYGVDPKTAHREYERMAKYFQRGGG